MRTIRKVFNNNVVQARTAEGHDVILVGAGVGFAKGRGAPVDESRVEREFHFTGQSKGGAFRVLLEIPYPVLKAVSKASERLASIHRVTLSSTAEVALADHVAQAISRLEEGVTLYNPLLWETRSAYPQEFLMALDTVELINAELGTRLPIDEVGSIALHLVHSGVLVGADRVMALSSALRRVSEIISEDLGLHIDDASDVATRFFTHVKFLIERLGRERGYAGPVDEVFIALRRAHEDVYACAVRIGAHLDEAFRTRTTEEEHLYLMLHLLRLRQVLHPESPPEFPPTETTLEVL